MQLNDYVNAGLVHEIHTSESKSFRACRRRWDWLFRQNYYPLITAHYFEFGIAYHKAMEVFYNPETWGMPRDVIATLAIKTFQDEHNKQKAKTLKALNAYELDPEREQEYGDRLQLGVSMLKYYFEKHAPSLDRGWTPLNVEVSFMVPIPHPDTGEYLWCKCDQCWQKWIESDQGARFIPDDIHDRTEMRDLKYYKDSIWKGLPVVYAGRLDVLERDHHGDIWIHDWKTAALLRDDTEYLELDDQVARYCWAMWKLGIRVRGFVYHIQRKAAPEPPAQNKTTRLGRKFSVSKQQATDYDTYLATVSTEDTEAYQMGLYDDFLQYLKEEGVVYYKRYQVHKSEAQIASVERNIGLEVLDMLDSSLRIYPSSGRFSCTTCAFRQPCLEKDDAGDYQYALSTMFEKRPHYYVREQASTESKGGE